MQKRTPVNIVLQSTAINLYKYPNNMIIKDEYTLPRKSPLLHYPCLVPLISFFLPVTGPGVFLELGLEITTGCFPGVLFIFMNASAKKKILAPLLFCSL